jgi:hypothetical protein
MIKNSHKNGKGKKIYAQECMTSAASKLTKINKGIYVGIIWNIYLYFLTH